MDVSREQQQIGTHLMHSVVCGFGLSSLYFDVVLFVKLQLTLPVPDLHVCVGLYVWVCMCENVCGYVGVGV